MASFNMSSGMSLRSFTFAPHIHCHSFSSSPIVASLSSYLSLLFEITDRRNRRVWTATFCAIHPVIVDDVGSSLHCLIAAFVRLASPLCHRSTTYNLHEIYTNIVIFREITRLVVAGHVFLVLIPQNTSLKIFFPRGDNKK